MTNDWPPERIARIGFSVVYPTEVDVERVAKTLAWLEYSRRIWRPDPLAWESRSEATRQCWRDKARAVLQVLAERE